MNELFMQRIIEPQLRPKSRDRLGVGALAHHRLHRVTRRHVEEEECDSKYAEKSGDEQCESIQYEPAHRVRSASIQR
jgi:hypothetical protein